MKTWLTSERALLARLLADGATWNECAAQLGRSADAVRSFGKREGYYQPDPTKNSPLISEHTAWRLRRLAEARAWREAWRARQ